MVSAQSSSPLAYQQHFTELITFNFLEILSSLRIHGWALATSLTTLSSSPRPVLGSWTSYFSTLSWDLMVLYTLSILMTTSVVLPCWISPLKSSLIHSTIYSIWLSKKHLRINIPQTELMWSLWHHQIWITHNVSHLSQKHPSIWDLLKPQNLRFYI